MSAMETLPNGIPASSLYFKYSPNIPLCYVCIILFFLLAVTLTAHVFFSKRFPEFMLLLPATAVLETVGFILRLVCAEDPNTGLFVAMSIFLLVPANLVISVNHRLVANVITASGVEERYRLIGPRFFRFFNRANLIAIALQSAGSGMQSSSQNSDKSKALAIVSIVVQIALFTVFLACSYYVGTRGDYKYCDDNQVCHKKKLMLAVYTTTSFLYIRLTYRLVFYILINLEGVQTFEWPFYAFDVLMLILCYLVYSLVPLQKYIPKDVNSLGQTRSLTGGKSHTQTND